MAKPLYPKRSMSPIVRYGAACFFGGAGAVHAQSPITAFVDVSVVPMDRERVLTRQTVLVRDGRIVAVGPVDQVKIPAKAERVEGRGKYLMPGLADMHAHVPSFGRTVKWVLEGADPYAAGGVEEAERMLFLALAHGITTVRLMFGWPATLTLRQRAAAGELVSPRIYAASIPTYPNTPELSSPQGAAAFVETAKSAGYDFIKMYGVAGEVLDTLLAVARRVGLPIAGHVPEGPDGLMQAIRMGYASIEHLNGFPEYLAGDEPFGDRQVNNWPIDLVIDSTKLRGLAEVMQREGVWNCPTLAIYEDSPYGADLWNADTLARFPELRYLAAEARAAVLNPSRRPSGTALETRRADRRAVVEARRTITKALHDAGVGLLLGTDASAMSGLLGPSVHRELTALVRAGLTPYEALATGTRNVAMFLGTIDSSGTIEVGKRADLVLLNGNPLTDISQTARQEGVMVGGRWLGRAELDRRLVELEGTLR